MSTKNGRLDVVAVEIRDVLGAKEFRLEPGQINVLEGRNGTGKSTALAALQAALGGGSLAKLARVDPAGAETEPEVVLVIEGQGNETYRVERTGEKVRVRARVGDTAAFEDVGKPQGWLSSLFDGSGSNPVRFLTAPDKERALLLLEALPLKFDRSALLAEMEIAPAEIRPVPAGLHPLEEISLIRQSVFDTRTGVNRDQKSAASSADQLRRNLPAVIPTANGTEVEAATARVTELSASFARDEQRAESALAQALTEARSEHDQAEARIRAEHKEAVRTKRAAHDALAAELRAAVERQIAEEVAAIEAQVEALREETNGKLESVATVLGAAQDEANRDRAAADRGLASLHEQLAQAKETLAVLRERAEGGAKARALAEQANEFDAQVDRLSAESERLTKALVALDAHRRRLAENLPIPGLSIEDRVIRVNGIEFGQLNTAQRVGIAVQVSCLRAQGQRLPVVFVDGAEALDREHFEALVSALKANGVQAFVGRVADHDLTVQVA